MKCVDVATAFNAPDGTRDPRAAGLIRADNHPTAKGAALIANLIAASGSSDRLLVRRVIQPLPVAVAEVDHVFVPA